MRIINIVSIFASINHLCNFAIEGVLLTNQRQLQLDPCMGFLLINQTILPTAFCHSKNRADGTCCNNLAIIGASVSVPGLSNQQLDKILPNLFTAYLKLPPCLRCCWKKTFFRVSFFMKLHCPNPRFLVIF